MTKYVDVSKYEGETSLWYLGTSSQSFSLENSITRLFAGFDNYWMISVYYLLTEAPLLHIQKPIRQSTPRTRA